MVSTKNRSSPSTANSHFRSQSCRPTVSSSSRTAQAPSRDILIVSVKCWALRPDMSRASCLVTARSSGSYLLVRS